MYTPMCKQHLPTETSLNSQEATCACNTLVVQHAYCHCSHGTLPVMPTDMSKSNGADVLIR